MSAHHDMLVASACSVVSALPVFLTASLALNIDESFAFSSAQLGVTVSLFYLGAATASVPFGRMAQRIGAARALRWGCLGMATVLVLIATTVHSTIWLAVALTTAGIISSSIQPAASLFIVQTTPPSRHGLAFGMSQAAVPTATLIGGLSVPLLGATVGWRVAFGVVAAIAFGVSLLLPTRSTTVVRSSATHRRYRLKRREMLALVVVACGFCTGMVAAGSLSSFAVSSAAHAGVSPSHAGLIASMGGLLAATARLSVGVVADHIRRNPLDIATIMMFTATFGYLLLAWGSTGTIPVLIVGVGLGFAAGWGWSGLLTLAVAGRFQQAAAEATAVIAVGGRLGGVIGPALFGLIVTHASYTTGWVIAAGAALAAGSVLLWGRRRLWTSDEPLPA